MNKIIFIKKVDESSYSWKNLIKRNRIAELSVKEVVSKYQGFAGELISSNPISFINKISEKSDTEGLTMLCLISNPDKVSANLESYFTKVGYEFGKCHEDIYSSIFSEILFGCTEELSSWKSKLNEYFLFETKSLAKEYASFHHQQLLAGNDVEWEDYMKIWEIWMYKGK